MPKIKSKRQYRWCKAAEKRGELPKGSCERGLREAGHSSLKGLPEKVGGDKKRGKRGKRGR